MSGKFGARFFLIDGKKVLIYTTVKRGAGKNERYVLPTSDQPGIWKDPTDVNGIGKAVLATLKGKLISP